MGKTNGEKAMTMRAAIQEHMQDFPIGNPVRNTLDEMNDLPSVSLATLYDAIVKACKL